MSSTSRAVINNGTLLTFSLWSITFVDVHSPNADSCGDVLLDINGFKGPNTMGKIFLGSKYLKRVRLFHLKHTMILGSNNQTALAVIQMQVLQLLIGTAQQNI